VDHPETAWFHMMTAGVAVHVAGRWPFDVEFVDSSIGWLFRQSAQKYCQKQCNAHHDGGGSVRWSLR